LQGICLRSSVLRIEVESPLRDSAVTTVLVGFNGVIVVANGAYCTVLLLSEQRHWPDELAKMIKSGVT
jgi:hypothetical protein